jgi:hypothetical protein
LIEYYCIICLILVQYLKAGVINICTVLLLKYKRYELKISQKEWKEFCSFLKRKFPQYDFNDDFYCTEVFDRNNNFKYAEVFLKLDSDYRAVMEEFKISEFKSFPETLKKI